MRCTRVTSLLGGRGRGGGRSARTHRRRGCERTVSCIHPRVHCLLLSVALSVPFFALAMFSPSRYATPCPYTSTSRAQMRSWLHTLTRPRPAFGHPRLSRTRTRYQRPGWLPMFAQQPIQQQRRTFIMKMLMKNRMKGYEFTVHTLSTNAPVLSHWP